MVRHDGGHLSDVNLDQEHVRREKLAQADVGIFSGMQQDGHLHCHPYRLVCPALSSPRAPPIVISVARRRKVVMSSADLCQVPSELDVFVDFISDDHRPTFVLDYSTTPKVLFRNDALDAILTDTLQESQFLIWISTIHETIRHQTDKHARRVVKVGTFASRHWSSKRLKGPWTAVFCRQNYQFENQWPYKSLGRPEQPSYSASHTLTREQLNKHSQQELSGYKHQDSERDDQRDTDSITTVESSPTSVLQEARGATGLLEDWTVDWLSFPHLTSDPWIQFLVKHDWSSTAAGPMQNWHPTLRQLYSTILTSEIPRIIYWGNDLCMFYNEAARFVVGEMHPEPLGNPLAKVWGASMCARLTEMLTSGIKRGKPMHNKGTELVIFRNGFLESAFFDFVFLPIPSPDGRFIGVLNDFIETTTSVLQEDRQRVCKKLIVGVTGATEVRNVWDTLLHVLKDCKDVSFAVVYTHDSTSTPESDTSSMRAQFSFGIGAHGSVLSTSINEIIGQSVNKVHVLDRPTGTLPPELEITVPKLGVVHTSYVLPIDGLYGQRVSAVVVIGSNPVRAVDAASIQYFESLRDLLFKSIALLSLPAEQRRANELSTALSYQLAVATSKAEKSERNFTEMVQHAPIGMCMDRGDGYPIYVNDVYLDLIGTDRTSFFDSAKAGFAWRSFDFQRNADAIEESWSAAVKSGKTASFEISVGCDTAPRWLEIFVQQRYDENGVLVFIFSWLTDISARKAVESVVEERLAEAIENRRASENFIDMVRMNFAELCRLRGLTSSRFHTRCVTLCPVSYNWPTAYR
jgi:PAS domain-containing protein